MLASPASNKASGTGTVTGKGKLKGEEVEDCFEKFLVSLADQQLVMSLAIPAALFTRWSKTSLFSLDLALTLVFTFLVTHLATIRYCPN
jgi:hypothetical protein